MFTLLDILQSQAGPGMQAIGQQFGLSPDQSRRAMEALLPALASGLQNGAASDPLGFGRLLGGVGLGPYLDPRPSTAQPDILGPLFGSPMLSQAVLQQASMASGVGAQALRQMLPVMAGMVVAGIVHVLLNQQQPVVQPPPAPAPEPSFPVAWFWKDWANSYLGGAEPPKPEARPHSAGLAPQPRETSGGTADHAAVRPPTSTALPEPLAGNPDVSAKLAPDGAPFEAFQHIFQTGVQVQEQNAKAMQTIFDAFWSAQPKHVAADKSATAGSAPTPAAPAALAPRSRRSPKVPKSKAPAARKPAARTRKDAGTKDKG